MINTEKFAGRLQKILDYHDLSAAAFADSIEVGRSSISHILSGRNKPSLEFVMKIVSSYPEVDLYWLLNGKGNFPKTIELEKIESTPSPILKKEKIAKKNSNKKKIQKIVFFYEDGSFEVFD